MSFTFLAKFNIYAYKDLIRITNFIWRLNKSKQGTHNNIPIYTAFVNRDIKIEVTGLGVLDWLVSSISTWVVGLFNDQIISIVDSHLQSYVSSILPTVDPNRFFG